VRGSEPPAELRDLAEDLRRHVDGEVRFDAGSRAAYSTDASVYREVPLGVVLPRSVEDLVAAVGVCGEHEAPILPRGAGTSMAGQACNVAVVLDTSRHLDRIVDIDPAARRARVEPGVVLDRLREAAAPHGLTFAPDPSTHDRCVIGGMIGNDACGVHSVRWGRTSHSVESLDVLLPDGTSMEVAAAGEDALDRIVAARRRPAAA
jgi:FAD/FMN-containing dehydrogenase